jgi:hypothetical protein
MSAERFRVLDMLRRQVLTVGEAHELLVALEENSGGTVELTVNLVQVSLDQVTNGAADALTIAVAAG